MRDTIANILRDCGVLVDVEQRVPAWDKKTRQGKWLKAKLDLRVEGGGSRPEQYLDVVIGHPVSTQDESLSAAASRDGSHAKILETGKFSRYNRQVIPLALETYGRWGHHAIGWWRQQAKNCAGRDPALAHYGKWAAPAMLARWWNLTSISVQRANVAAILSVNGWKAPQWKPVAAEAPPAWEVLCGRSGFSPEP